VFLVNCTRNFGRLPGEVEVFSDALLGGRLAAKGVVIEGIVGFVQLLA
jgi:hypothetical protein